MRLFVKLSVLGFVRSPQLNSNRLNFLPVIPVSAIIYKKEEIREMIKFCFTNSNHEVSYEMIWKEFS